MNWRHKRFSRRSLLALAAAAGSPLSAQIPAQAQPLAASTPQDEAEVIRLWRGPAPGANAKTRRLKPQITERSVDPTYHDRFAVQTTEPVLTVVRPTNPNGAGMLLIPGGGYRWAVVDKEGLDCARVFAEAGITCFVLRYRLPADGWEAGADAPLQDAQRAMRLIRANAIAYGVQPNRLAVLGASAGGHLAGMLARSAEKLYAPVDSSDAVSAAPDATILLYPVVTMGPLAHAGSRTQLLGESPTPAQIAAYSLENRIAPGMAPTFVMHALDDPSVPVENTLSLLAALRVANVASECHLFQEGGHGFGIRLAAGKPAAIWPRLVLNWGARNGWLT